MSRWIPFDPTWIGDLRPAPGCYVIFHGPQVIYVGQSENVRARIRQHGFRNVISPRAQDMRDGDTTTPWGARPWHAGQVTGKVCYPRRYGEQLMIEARLIRRLCPEHNIRGVARG